MGLESSKQLLRFEDIGTCATIFQHYEQPLTQIFCLNPMVILVLQGTKIIEFDHQKSTVHAGEILVIPAGTTLDIINLNPVNDSYLACYFTWESKPLKYYEKMRESQHHAYLESIKILKDIPESFQESFLQISNQLTTTDHHDLVNHKFVEILIWLEQMGIVFSSIENLTLSQKITQLISQAPNRKWQAKEIAQHFHLGESTMRRHLANENTSVSQLIQNVRTSYGLTLLQTTHWNIEDIAQEAGYESGSRFAYYFRQRFGFLPSEMKNNAKQNREIRS